MWYQQMWQLGTVLEIFKCTQFFLVINKRHLASYHKGSDMEFDICLEVSLIAYGKDLQDNSIPIIQK